MFSTACSIISLVVIVTVLVRNRHDKVRLRQFFLRGLTVLAVIAALSLCASLL